MKKLATILFISAFYLIGCTNNSEQNDNHEHEHGEHDHSDHGHEHGEHEHTDEDHHDHHDQEEFIVEDDSTTIQDL